MKRTETELPNIASLTVPAIGYELIREELLYDILGQDAPSILYWAGKRLARKYPLFTINEICEFFQRAGWGDLQMEEQKKNEMTFSLSGDLIIARLHSKVDPTFQLEAGFLAEQIGQQNKVYAESYEHPKKKNNIIIFTIKWDHIPFDE